ncbi:hypothetical protein ACI65C_012159 [Semiaphis heraclei]
MNFLNEDEEKTTTVVAADTKISSESNKNNNNAPGNNITVKELIQKHFDIPLIIAEDEPKVYNFIKSAQLLTSNEISEEKKKIDQFMENLVDDSYVARGLGLITATVGRQSEFYLYSKYDNNFENIVIRLSGRNGEIGEIKISSLNLANIVETKTIPIDYFYDKDRIKVTYTPFAEGVYTLTLIRNSVSICRSPYYISVEKSPTNSRSQIRLGTKKYKPVTKFSKAKHSPLETCDNSLPVIEISKPPICKNILPATEEHSTRTDVMSMVTKFESNSIHFQKKVHKRTSSIPEKSSGTNFIDEISRYTSIQPKIETDNVCNTNFSDLDSPSVQSKSKSNDENFRNCVDLTNKNSKANYMNAINFETERIKKPSTKLEENIKIKKDIPWVKNVSSTHLKPTNSVLVESLTDENSHNVEIQNQTIKTTELISKNNHDETILDPTTKIDDYGIKYIDDGPCLQNEISCFDDDDRKTVVAMENNNELPSNSNDTVIQQITDSAQYNINTSLASFITQIANSVCEKCSLQVLKTISEFPRDINITHNNNSNEIRSSFETLLAQPISININIDNMFEHPISATNEHNSENKLNNNSPEKIKRLGTTDKNIKCNYLNEIEPINNSFDELYVDINNMSSELIIKHNEHNSEISKAIKDQIVDHCTVPFAENTMNENKTVHQKNELSANEIMKIKCSATKEENVLHLNQLNNNTTHKSDNEIGIQGRHLQKSSEHNMALIKPDQFHKNNISKENDKPLDTSYLVTTSDNTNHNEEVVVDEFKINNVFIPDEHTNIQMSVINNTVLASKVVPLEILVYKSKDDEEQTNIISNKNATITSILNENQKLMIEKSIEPVLASFKNKIIEKITQLYLNKTLPNTDNTTIIETHDKHLTNNSKEIHNTEINTKYIETLTSQPKNHIDQNKISEIILDRKKIGNNHLFKNVENLIKTNMNSSDTLTQTLPEIKLRTLVNTAMNHSNYQQIDNEFQKTITDNVTQDVELKKMNNGDIVQHMDTMLAETPSDTIIENTGELISSKNNVTVKTQCEIPLINDFDSIEIDHTNTDNKQRMQLINVNENQTIIETNAMEKKVLPNCQKSHNTVIITPNIELRPTLETQITNISELVKIEDYSLKEIQTTIEIIESNLSEETDVAGNINNKEEYESVKLQIKENVIIKIPHMVEKEAINEIVENISTNTPTKSNSTESLSIQQTKKREIESLESKIVFDANDVIIDRKIIHKSKPINTTEHIFVDKSNLQIKTALNAQVSKNAAKIILGINTSFSESTTVIDAPNEPDMKVDEVLIGTEAETSTIIDNSTTSLVRKIMVEFVANKDKKQIETLENILQKQIEDDIVTAREKDSTINSLAEVIDEQVNTKNDVSVKYYLNSDDNIQNTKQNDEKKHPSPIISLKEISVDKTNMNIDEEDEKLLKIVTSSDSMKEIKEIDRLNITIPIQLTMESIEVSKEVVDMTKEKTTFNNSSTVTVEVQTDVEKVIGEESPSPINSLGEVEQENMIMSINTETKTIFPIESIIEIIDEPKIVNGKTKTEILQCNESSIEIMDHQNHSDKIVDNESINTLGEAVNENINLNIDIQNETLLSNESTTKSMMEPKLKEDTTVTVITSCTDSLNVILDDRKDILNIIEDKSLTTTYSLDKVVEKNINKVDIDTETETHIVITESVNESIAEPKIVEDITETDSSIEIVDTQIDVDKELDEITPISINTSDEVVEEKTKYINLDLKKTTLLPIETSAGTADEVIVIEMTTENLLPIESTVESINKPKLLENITEIDITSCTESLTEMNDDQNHKVKIIDQESLVEDNSPDEMVGVNINVKIDTQNETILPTESTMESIKETTGLVDTAEAQILACTDPYIVTAQAQINVDNEIDQVTPVPINSSVEVTEETNIINTDTEKEMLIQFKTSTDSGVEMIMVEKTTEKLLPTESTTESMEEPIEDKDLTETEILACTGSSITTADAQINVDSEIYEVTPVPINSSVEVTEETNIINTDTEKEILLPIRTSIESREEIIVVGKTTEDLLPIESTIESIHKSTEENDLTQTKILACTGSSIVSTDAQINVDNEIDEVTPVPINSSVEATEETNIINTGTEKEILISIKISKESGEEMPVVEKTTENLLPIESTIESIDKSTVVEDITDTEIAFTKSTSAGLREEIILIEKTTDNLLPIESTTESKKNSTAVEETHDTEIPTCVDCFIVKNITNIDTEQETFLPIKTSTDLGEEMIMVEKKTDDILPIESTAESIEELTGENKFSQSEILTCVCSSITTADAQINVDNNIDEVTLAPKTSSVETREKKKITNTDAEKEISIQFKTSADSGEDIVVVEQKTENILPIELTIESIEEPIGENGLAQTEILTGTDSSIVTVDKGLEEFNPTQIDYPDNVAEVKNIINTDTEKETLLPTKTSIESREEIIVVGKTTEDLLPIELTIESMEEPIQDKDLTETEILTCTGSSILSTDAQIIVDNEIDEVTLVPINSSVEPIEETNIVNTDTEKEILLPIRTSFESGEEMIVVKKTTEDLLPIESTIESMEEPIEDKDLTETEILACTGSFIMTTDAQINVDNENEVTPVPINSSVEVTEETNIINTDTEKEILLPIRTSIESGEKMIVVEKTTEDLLPIESTIESIHKSTEENDLTQTEILAYTGSSIVSTDAQIIVDNEIDEVTLVPINFSVEPIEETNIVNIDTEKEILLPIRTSFESGEEMIVVEKTTEDLLPIESTIESMEEPIEDKDLTETEILAYTGSSIMTTDAQINVDNENEVTPVPINSSVEVTEETNIINTDTEKEILLPIRTSIESGEKMIVVEKTTEDLLPIESTVESMDEPTVEKDMSETEISFTKSSNEMIDNQNYLEKIVEHETLVENNSSDEVVGGNVNLSIDKEYETLSTTISVLESITEAKIVEDITDTIITSCTEFTSATVNAQTNEDKYNEEELPASIYSADEKFGENINVNIDKEKERIIPPDICTESSDECKKIDELIETLLPTESTIEEPIAIEHKNEAEISTFIESSTEIIDNQNHTEKMIDQDSLVTNNSLDAVVKDNMHVNIDTEDETILPIELNKESILEEDITVTTSISGTDFSNKTSDVQKDVQQVIEEKALAPISSLVKVVGEFTNVNVVTDNETLLKTNSLSMDVNSVIEERVIENKYSTPIIASILVLEKQIQKQTLLPVIEIHTAFVDEPNVVEYVSGNEHTAHIDSSTINVKDQVEIDSEIKIETVSLIDNLTDSVKKQIIEKNTENKNPTLNYSLAEVVEQGCNVKIDTDNQLLLPTNTSSTTVDDQIIKNVIENETKTPIYCLVDVSEEQNKMNIKNNNEITTPIDMFVSVEVNVKYSSENEHTQNIDSTVQNQTKIDSKTENETLLSIDNHTKSVEEQMQVEVMKNESVTVIDHSTTHDVAQLEESNVIKNNTTEMISSVTVTEEQKTVNSTEVVTDTCDDSLDKTMLEKSAHNETPISINILAVTVEKQTDLEEITENKIPMLVDTSIEPVDKQIKIEKVSENETTTLITCGAEPKVETDEYEMESGNETSIPVNYSASVAMKQTEVNNLTERTLPPNDDNMYRNTKKNLIDEDIKTGNLNSSNKCYLKFGETSKMHHLENEDNLHRKSYGIQKLEMSVQRMKTSDEDYYEKTFVQLEQTEKISNVNKVDVDGENKTIKDDKLYTVNESDLNAILCASSLEEALTMLDSKIKFKFKHKKSSSKMNSTEYIPKIETSDSKNSGVNTNFTDAREFFKEIEKKSKK